MFGPYRTPPEPQPRERRTRPHEEIVLAWALLAIGAVRVVFAIASREVWGAEPTLAMLLTMGGIGMLARR